MLNRFDGISDFDLKPFTTLKIGGLAQVAYSPTSVGDMIECIKFHHKKNEPINVIGAGSNLLVSSHGVEGGVVLTHKLRDVIQIDDDKIYALCGAKASAFSKVAYEAGLTGAEFMIGIPGSVGGALYMNAGAHGENLKPILESVKILNMKSYVVTEVPVKYLKFNYRKSTFMNDGNMVLSAIFKMQKGDKDKIKERMDFHVNYRAKNHPPLSEFSAGSTFRNPKGHYAANLLESVGAKDYIENSVVKFSSKHANFLYNFNDATSTDVVRLMHNMWSKVKSEYGIKLHPEIRFVGIRTKEEDKLWKAMIRR